MLADGTEDTSAERYDEDIIAQLGVQGGRRRRRVRHQRRDARRSTSRSRADVTWLSAWGIQIESGIARARCGSSRKLYDRIARTRRARGQYSVEAWITNAKTSRSRVRRASSPTRRTPARATSRSARRSTTTTSATAASSPEHRRQRHAGADYLRRRPGPAGPPAARGHHLRPVPRAPHLRGRPLDRRRRRAAGGPALQLGSEPRLRARQRDRATTASGRARSASWRSTTRR